MKQKGFTLVELMVVMAVIAILAATALVAFTGVQKGARDTTRKTNISQFRTALENYYATSQSYPGSGTCAALAANSLVTNFMSAAPTDPLPAQTCTYTQLSGGSGYVIGQILETGGVWVACDSALSGGKQGRVTGSTVPLTCTL